MCGPLAGGVCQGCVYRWTIVCNESSARSGGRGKRRGGGGGSGRRCVYWGRGGGGGGGGGGVYRSEIIWGLAVAQLNN